MYLAINWWKIQQNMHGCFLEIPVFLGDYFIMPHPVGNGAGTAIWKSLYTTLFHNIEW